MHTRHNCCVRTVVTKTKQNRSSHRIGYRGLPFHEGHELGLVQTTVAVHIQENEERVHDPGGQRLGPPPRNRGAPCVTNLAAATLDIRCEIDWYRVQGTGSMVRGEHTHGGRQRK